MSTFDYYSKQMPPASRNYIWAEIIHMEGRDHRAHPLITAPDKFHTQDGKNVGTNDFYEKSWEWIRNKYYQAAGQPSSLVDMARITRVNPFEPPTARTRARSLAREADDGNKIRVPGSGRRLPGQGGGAQGRPARAQSTPRIRK